MLQLLVRKIWKKNFYYKTEIQLTENEKTENETEIKVERLLSSGIA